MSASDLTSSEDDDEDGADLHNDQVEVETVDERIEDVDEDNAADDDNVQPVQARPTGARPKINETWVVTRKRKKRKAALAGREKIRKLVYEDSSSDDNMENMRTDLPVSTPVPSRDQSPVRLENADWYTQEEEEDQLEVTVLLENHPAGRLDQHTHVC